MDTEGYNQQAKHEESDRGKIGAKIRLGSSTRHLRISSSCCLIIHLIPSKCLVTILKLNTLASRFLYFVNVSKTLH